MSFHIATNHTNRKCKYCRHNLFIGCAFWNLGPDKFICESCVNLMIAYLIIMMER
jgi:hypothetical protein